MLEKIIANENLISLICSGVIYFKQKYISDKVINQFDVVLTRFICNRNFNLLQNKLLEDEKLMKEKLKNDENYKNHCKN